MTKALIGHSGFVGGSLLRQVDFDARYRSTNIGDIAGKEFDTIVCAGAPAQKWIANREPEADLGKVEHLIASLETVRCRDFVLISTVDVFRDPQGIYEDSPVEEAGLHAYGRHRRLLERFVEDHYPRTLIVRLPGLVGPGLRKNVIFDFLNGNNLHLIDSRGVFQFYPMVNLWYDIQTALAVGLRLVHMTASPISVADVSLHGFGRVFDQRLAGSPARYDMRTRYSSEFGAAGDYQYGVRETIQAIRCYEQSEPATLKTVQDAAK
jgi:dTDP-4-dehydrorhamnose reductase